MTGRNDDGRSAGGLLKIELLGTSFTVQTDEPVAHVERVLDYYRRRIAEIERSVTTRDALKTAILAAMLVTDELLRGRDATGSPDGDELERITNDLISSIDATLGE